MPILLYHGNPATDRSIRSRVARGAFETFLVIVPTRRRMRHLQRSALAPGGPPAHGLQIHTIETLALRLLPRLRPELALADGILPALLYQQAIRTAGEGFAYFTLRHGPFPLPPGTFSTITSVLTHLRETGVDPDALEAELPLAEPDEIHKLADVIGMARAYEDLLGARSAVDVPGVFQILASRCSQGRFTEVFREFHPAVDLICVAGFDEFTEPELGLLTRLRSLEGTGLLFAFDFVPGNPALFGHLEENVERFRSLGLRPVDVPPEELLPAVVDTRGRRDPNDERALDRVIRRLFAPGGGGDREALGDAITLVAARTRREEVEAVCRLIKSVLLRSPDREPGRICVAMINPSAYTTLLRHAFERYGIPANVTDRFSLARAPVVTGIMGLLQIVARDFLRDDVLRVVSRPEFRPAGRGERVFDAAALARVSGRLKITGGYDGWIRRIDRQLSRPGGNDAAAAELAGARLDLENLRDQLLPLSEPLTPGEFPARLREVLDGFGLLERMLRGAPEGDPLAPERETRAYAKFLAVVDDVCAFLSGDPDAAGAHPPAFFLDQLTVALSGERYNVREEFGRGVLVTAIEETRGLPIDIMILIGLVDGEFPSVYQAEVFYSLARQKRRARRHAWEQRYLFYQAITNWSEHLYLFHPGQEGGCELVRSTFLDSLLGVADVRQVSPAQLVPETDVLSPGEALCAAAGYPGIEERLTPAMQREVASLRRAVAGEKDRIFGESGSPFTGILRGHLSARGDDRLTRFGARVFSVSQLEGYARCPYRFFGERVLALRTQDDLVESLDPVERGTLLHAILYAASVRMRGEGLPRLPEATAAQMERAERILLEAAEEELARIEVPDPFWDLDRERLLGGPSGGGILREYLAHERSRTTKLTPRYFEVAFGPGMRQHGGADTELSQEEPVTVGGIRLRGRIDRVEIGDGLVAVVDYKTGASADTVDRIRRGLSLQLPLYLLIAARLLERSLGHGYTPSAGFHYLLGDRVVLRPVLANMAYKGIAFEGGTRQTLPDDAAFAELLGEAVAHAEGIIAGVRAGSFPLTAPENRPKTCPPCPFKGVCRVQVVRPLGPEEQEEA